MTRLLCQVCGRTTVGRSDERHLFLAAPADGRPLAEGERTITPPVHEACALESIEACPHLHRGHTAALVEYPALWGVAGILCDPRTVRPLYEASGGLTYVAFDDPRIRWTLAACLVVTLQGCTTVDVRELAAQPATQGGPLR